MDRFGGATRRPPVLIVVMGITGVGKSYFISKATGERLDIGNSLESTTKKIRMHSLSFGDTNVFLIDTPGFDDPVKSDVAILEEFVNFLREISSFRLRISGIIYLHRISDNRMTGSAQKNIKLLTELCGKDYYKHIVLVTTMWDRIDPKIGEEREEMLESKFWMELIRHGAKSRRFEGSRESAIDIIKILSDQQLTDAALLNIQQEVINYRIPLPKTDAGRVVIDHLRDERDKTDSYLRDVKQLHKGMFDDGSAWSNPSRRAQIEKEMSELEEKRDEIWKQEERFINSPGNIPPFYSLASYGSQKDISEVEEQWLGIHRLQEKYVNSPGNLPAPFQQSDFPPSGPWQNVPRNSDYGF